MAKETGIAWATNTFNPWMGCTAVSPACDHCYAEARMDTRLHVVKWGAGQPRKRTSAANWREPLKWDRKRARAIAAGENPPPHRVFCASLADVFDNEAPDEWRADLFALIRATPNLTWMLLTKRIGNANRMITTALLMQAKVMEASAAWPWPNVWIGATVVNQEEADRDIPKLLAVSAAVRFLSIEPMLGAINLPGMLYYGTERSGGVVPLRDKGYPQIDWVICGGESGKDARPMHPDWARSLRDQCVAAGTSFFFKQWGEWWETAHDATDEAGRALELDPDYAEDAKYFERGDRLVTIDGRTFSSLDAIPPETPCRLMQRVGTKAGGDILDGRQWQQFPDTPPTP